jgi:hypothetical protein
MNFEILSELGPWGIAVLIGVMGGTQALKPLIKELHANKMWIFGVQTILACIGSVCLAVGNRVTGIKWDMVPLIWFVVSFTGPLLYMYILKPMLQKKKREIQGG